MRDPHSNKIRDLRRLARSAIEKACRLFLKYYPEFRDEEFWTVFRLQRDWIEHLSGGKSSSAPPSKFRRQENRLRRHRNKLRFINCCKQDTLDDYIEPKQYRTIRHDYW